MEWQYVYVSVTKKTTVYVYLEWILVWYGMMEDNIPVLDGVVYGVHGTETNINANLN